MDLRSLFNTARDNAGMLFRIDHEVSPLWHAVTETGEQFLVSTPWNSEKEKIASLRVVRDTFRTKHVERYAFICEAWVAEIKNPKGVIPRPIVHPDRREVLRITAEDRSGATISGSFYILRPEHGEPALSPFKEDKNYTHVTGRLVNMLGGA